MEYLIGILGVVVGVAIVSVFKIPARDPQARAAIIALGKEFNRNVYIYDYSSPLVHIDSFERERLMQPLTVVEGNKNAQQWNEKVERVGRDVRMLFRHFGLEIERAQQTPERIVKTK